MSLNGFQRRGLKYITPFTHARAHTHTHTSPVGPGLHPVGAHAGLASLFHVALCLFLAALETVRSNTDTYTYAHTHEPAHRHICAA